MYETAVDLLHTKTGLKHYEVSNYAAPGHESVHNLAYWKGWDYIGVGPGAHGHGTQVSKQLEKQTMIKELIVLGLRIKEGLSFTTAQELAFGESAKQSLDWDAVKRHCEMGFLEYDERREILKPTERGLSVIDTILANVIKQ
ncbi:hypothetical protein HDU99_000439 [Rhizoclosmatium hyalinum]|nr:hypothetical protein HDU99_000439 [Rhizoclosmatium hyalinum]